MVENINPGQPRSHYLLFSATQNIEVLYFINIFFLFGGEGLCQII